jgi:hypothetical protein
VSYVASGVGTHGLTTSLRSNSEGFYLMFQTGVESPGAPFELKILDMVNAKKGIVIFLIEFEVFAAVVMKNIIFYI